MKDAKKKRLQYYMLTALSTKPGLREAFYFLSSVDKNKRFFLVQASFCLNSLNTNVSMQ